jgi:hypothetical protein
MTWWTLQIKKSRPILWSSEKWTIFSIGLPNQTNFTIAPIRKTRSCHDSSNETRIKEKQNKTIPNSNSNITKSMTHHNQIKKLISWFLNLPLDKSIDNKSTKFEVWIQDRIKHSYKTKKQEKTQEGHLEEGKPQKPIKGMKSGKVKQNGKKELRKAQKSKKSSNQRKAQN